MHPGARQQQARALRELRQGLAQQGDARRGQGDDHDRVGLQLLHRVRQRVHRRVRAQVGDAPAALAQREPEQQQPEVVALARRAGQQRARSHAAVPAPGQRDQPPAQHHAREVLLRDRGLAALPALAQLAQVGQQHLARQGVEAQPGDEQVEHDLRPRVVEVVQGLAQLVGHAFERWGQPGRRRLGLEHQARGLAR